MLYSIFSGLAPNTLYRVSVRAKNIRAPHFDDKASIPVEKFSCHIDFRTLPKGEDEISVVLFILHVLDTVTVRHPKKIQSFLNQETKHFPVNGKGLLFQKKIFI